ncbi:MAG: apolipoprotein N-acyltransferase [Opitutales bacterium]|nr:apolipoprotein N-acyltransferase [Opitutales bacterium]
MSDSFRERVEARRGIKPRRRSMFDLGLGAQSAISAMIVGLLSAILYVIAFAPFDFAEAAFLFAIPWIIWGGLRPGWRMWVLTVLASQWFAWSMILIWLRHVANVAGAPLPSITGPLIVMALALVVTLVQLPWFALVRWAVPLLRSKPAFARIVGLFGIAGAWSLLEWVRSWLFTGFPWAVLASSQWRNPVALQPASYGGAYLVSALLIAVNLAISFYVLRFIGRKKATGWIKSLCPELYVVVSLLMITLILYMRELPNADNMRAFFTASAIQPAIPQDLKWDRDRARENLDVLESQSRLAVIQDVDLLLWPESSTPEAVSDRFGGLETWVEALSAELETPILMGNLIEEPDGSWYNGIFFVDPETGLKDSYYAKRKRVPFGEYVPLRWLPFVDKAVPLDYDIQAGESAAPMQITVDGSTFRVGGLVCYEDVFPHLSRETAQLGVDLFLVVTNDAWYGREAAAYQHAAHSVLRAVETRRPVVRVGNEGWSGWIDAQGRIRQEFVNAAGSIYTRGSSPMLLFRDIEQQKRPSFYVQYGDWFLWVAAGLLILTVVFIRIVPDLKDPDPEKNQQDESNIFNRRRRLKKM